MKANGFCKTIRMKQKTHQHLMGLFILISFRGRFIFNERQG